MALIILGDAEVQADGFRMANVQITVRLRREMCIRDRGKGYTAGVGMSIGTTFGRIAGQQAARAAQQEKHHEVA